MLRNVRPQRIIPIEKTLLDKFHFLQKAALTNVPFLLTLLSGRINNFFSCREEALFPRTKPHILHFCALHFT